jgi:hypothetical protein
MGEELVGEGEELEVEGEELEVEGEGQEAVEEEGEEGARPFVKTSLKQKPGLRQFVLKHMLIGFI